MEEDNMEKEISYPQSWVKQCVEHPFDNMEKQNKFIELILDFNRKRVELEKIGMAFSIDESRDIRFNFDIYHMEKYIIKHLSKCIFENLNSYKEFEERNLEDDPFEEYQEDKE